MSDAPTKLRRGRQPGSLNRRTLFARDYLDRMDCDPVMFLMQIVNQDTIEVSTLDDKGNVSLDAAGKPIKTWARVTTDQRMAAASTLLPYLFPRLSAQQIHGEVKVPIDVTLPIERILGDPQLSSAMAQLALLVASAGDDSQRAAPLPYAVITD